MAVNIVKFLTLKNAFYVNRENFKHQTAYIV